MKERNQGLAKKVLKTHRRRIDAIDDRILKLLGERFGIARKVAKIKIKNDIPAFLWDRVHEVRERSVAQSKKYGIDRDFVRSFYTLLIYQTCATEDLLKYKVKRRQKKKK